MVRLSDFDFNLPDELIAQTPLTDRAAARLLHLDPKTGEIHHRMFRDVINLLNPGDVLVLNNTRVNAWRFRGKKPTGGEVEILCLKEIEPGVYESLIKPAKRLKPGATFDLGEGVTGTVMTGGEEPIRIVKLSCNKGDLNSKLSQIGEIPLPPYITEKLNDNERYQTIFSNENGSAAAPTAGLHFTKEILDQLIAKGIKIAYVTLHIGIDTFRPIQVDDVTNHQMHGEVCEISPEAAEMINMAMASRTSSFAKTDPGGESVENAEHISRVNVGATLQNSSPAATNFDKTDPGGVPEGSQGVAGSLSPSDNGSETPGKTETVPSPRSLIQATARSASLRATPPQAMSNMVDRKTTNYPLPTANSQPHNPRIIAVGTTAVRTLESFADPDGTITSGRKTSRLFITPGYDLKVVDGMFTNFHFPRTTMLLMISALASREKILHAYQTAVEEKYRFLSFGDSMLLLKS